MYTHVCGPVVLQFTLAQIQYGRGPYPYLSIHIIPFRYHSTFTSIHSWHGSIQVPSFKRFWQVTKFIFELNAWQFGHTLQCQLLLVDRVTFKERPSCIHSGWNKDLCSDERPCTSRTMSAKGSWSYQTYDDVPQKRLPLNAMYLTGHGFSFLPMKYWIDQNKLIGHDLAWDAIVASAFKGDRKKHKKHEIYIYIYVYIPFHYKCANWSDRRQMSRLHQLEDLAHARSWSCEGHVHVIISWHPSSPEALLWSSVQLPSPLLRQRVWSPNSCHPDQLREAQLLHYLQWVPWRDLRLFVWDFAFSARHLQVIPTSQQWWHSRTIMIWKSEQESVGTCDMWVWNWHISWLELLEFDETVFAGNMDMNCLHEANLQPLGTPSCLPVPNGFSLGSNSDPPRHPESSPLDVWTPAALSLLQQPAVMLLLIFSLTIFPSACLLFAWVSLPPSLCIHTSIHPPSHQSICIQQSAFSYLYPTWMAKLVSIASTTRLY